MTDNYTVLNPGVDGDVMDETGVVYGTAPIIRKRPRVVITGENLGEIVPALNSNPVGSEFGLVTRSILSNYPGTSVTVFNTTTLVPTSTETTVTTYTVPSSVTFYFIGLISSGNANAVFKLYVDGNPVLAGRTSVANLNLNMTYSYAVFTVPEGSTISLKVKHEAPVGCDFEGTILGYIL